VFCWGYDGSTTHRSFSCREFIFHLEDKKNIVSRSGFDYWCVPGVFAFPFLRRASSSMEFDFCFAIKDSPIFKTVVCSTNSSSHYLSRECETYTFNSFSLAVWRSRNEEDLFGSSKVDAGKSRNQLLEIVQSYRGHLHKALYKGILQNSKEWKGFTVDLVPKSA